MKISVKDIGARLEKLLKQEQTSGSKLGRCGFDITIHDKSKNINAGVVEAQVRIYENDDSNYPLEIIKCSILVVEKTTINTKTQDEFTRTCSIVMNDTTHEIIWNKMSRDSTIAAVNYCFGYILNSSMIARGRRPIQNIGEYVKSIVDLCEPHKS